MVTMVAPRMISHPRGGQRRALRLGNHCSEAALSASALPRRTAISSAVMLTAISCGVTAPRSRPIGAWMRASRSGSTPPSRHQLFVEARDLGAAADQAHVAQLARRERAQGVEVVAVAAGHDHGVGRAGQRRARQPLRECRRRPPRRQTESARCWRTRRGRRSRARRTRPRAPSSPGSSRRGRRRRCRPPATASIGSMNTSIWPPHTRPGLFGEVVVEVVLHGGGLARREHGPGLADGVVLVAAAADRADNAAVAKHQHLRADALRRGPVGRDDRDQGGFFATRQRFPERGKDFVVHVS